MPHAAPSPRTRVRRLHDKAAYDRAVINAILDAMPVAHVGHVVDGVPVVTPTLQWREGDRVYWHGSSASRMQKRAAREQVCLTVTLTDGMVLARSGFEHSVNYRSVMVFGQAEVVADAAKTAHLRAMMDQMFPGRWDQLRPITAQEVKATRILSLPLTEASAKISAGPPTDPPEDCAWPVWAGVIPIRLIVGEPVPAPDLAPDLPVPDHAKGYSIG
ncbi:pyridoxamine 5'-phosphate oxidase family protein [Tabrizicola sp.]|jgi:nitroimidazol reductase NimA-like FMN-containing flavoprotein (pyridoxamine 5'-phosphate oxidase superfamily)|uniref:pyridoxamine 5'-phosphate oxidase family protein n=1 Tax=Tabrizicola sp. TaxID=2005166 RepID=UPI001A3B40F8|nr:pyridoxamine 5'-phosphate oxidase family protein [Tabrizicola sp.]MBL9063540.1 pyridoxamine 5'-phosphate oxidase family protein [Tabrizicola sp.]